jgi:hypothetical protein
MPVWATVVLTLGASVIAVIGTLVATRLQHNYGRRDRELTEQRDLRERGAAVLTPLASLLSQCQPSNVLINAGVLMFEQVAQIDERLPSACNELMAYANAHPMPQMAEAAFRLVTAVRNAVRATMWLLSEQMKVHRDSRFYLDVARSDHDHAERLYQAVLSAARGELDGPSLTRRVDEVEKVKATEEEHLATDADSRSAR